MIITTPPEAPRTVRTAGDAASLLVRQEGSPLAEAAHQALLAAGCRVAVAATTYDAVAEADRLGPTLAHVFVGVDFLSLDDLRFIPLVRREWPHAKVIAYHGPAYAHKGRLAEILGADVVANTWEQMTQIVTGLTQSAANTPAPASPPAPAAAQAVPVAIPVTPSPAAMLAEALRPAASAASAEAPMSAHLSHDTAAAIAAAALALRQMRTAPAAVSPPAASPAVRTPAPVAAHAAASARSGATAADPLRDLVEDDEDLADSQILGTIELTEEELRLLLGEGEES